MTEWSEQSILKSHEVKDKTGGVWRVYVGRSNYDPSLLGYAYPKLYVQSDLLKSRSKVLLKESGDYFLTRYSPAGYDPDNYIDRTSLDMSDDKTIESLCLLEMGIEPGENQ